VRGARPESAEEESPQRFVHEAVLGLATLRAEDLAPGNLTVPLGLSLWMRRGGIGVMRARTALLALRDTVLHVSGLDARTEPVPLVVADPGAASISLALYLYGLLDRAAGAMCSSRLDVAERALEHLSS